VIAESLPALAVVVLVISTLMLLLGQNWRWNILALALQYLALFALILQVWPLGLAVVKLVAGWMAGAILSASQPGVHLAEDSLQHASAFIFRLLLAIVIWIVVISLTPFITSLVPLPPFLVMGAILLIGMGLVQLGVTTRPLRVLFGLFTTLAGFELLYAAVENSVLVAGLLAVVTLGLAFLGAYLFDILSGSEETS
jgi:hypothetical protein